MVTWSCYNKVQNTLLVAVVVVGYLSSLFTTPLELNRSFGEGSNKSGSPALSASVEGPSARTQGSPKQRQLRDHTRPGGRRTAGRCAAADRDAPHRPACGVPERVRAPAVCTTTVVSLF